MNSIELCQKIWNKINKPYSMCPDIEIGYVEQIMAELLSETLNIENALDKLLLAKILISPTSPTSFSNLVYFWSNIKEHQIKQPVSENGDYKADLWTKYYLEVEELATTSNTEVTEALKRLVDQNLIELRENVYWPLDQAYKAVE
jgi:hypothetical protein